MRLRARLRSWARILFRRSRMDTQLNDELRFHIDTHAEDLVRAGLTRQEAVRQARLAFGGLDSAKEECREATGAGFVESFLQDVRFGLRMLRKNPGFTVVAVLTLALGIGANAAIFSVVDAVLLRPLAYNDADRLVTILHYGTGPISPANYLDYRDQSASYAAMAAAEYWSPNLTAVQSPEHLIGLRVTQNTLPLLGVRPQLGRLFADGEDRAGSDHEVILSYGLWQRRFSGDTSALGKTIILDGSSYSIVGVMPADFHFAPFWATHAELWAPLSLEARAHSRDGNSLRLFARLKPGVTLDHARAEMAAITARLETEYPGTNTDIQVVPLKEKVVGNVQTPLLILLGAVGFVLLIACANVAHMLLARASARQKEIAVRTALGARRSRVARQVLTENALLASLGGVLGLLLAIAGTRALVSLSPAELPRVESVTIDGRVVLFLFAITALTTVVFGLVPALQSSNVNLTDALKETGRATTEGPQRSRLRNFLVASEFALALALLVAAGLMIRSFSALESIDPGFNPHGVLSMVVPVAGSKEADPGRRAVFYREMLDRVRALPGVESAAGINHLPIAGDLWDRTFIIEGRPLPDPNHTPDAVYRIVTPGYFQTMNIPVVRGRDFAPTDNSGAPPVVVVNERLAQRYWPNENPIGQHIAIDTKPAPQWITVVGVTKDVAEHDWAAKTAPELYLAAFQAPDFLGTQGSGNSSYITLVLRTNGDPAVLTSSVKSAIWSLDPDLPISSVLTMDDVIAQANAQPRFEMLLLAVFATVALLLAGVGIYGVMSYAVSRRTHEIGVRISLGASRRNVLLLVMKQATVLAIAGLSAGLALALFFARLMTKLVYGISPTDPITFVSVAALLFIVALLACYVPARRAMRVDPVSAMRCE